MSFVEGPVRVRVPATSANLGPGYDALGLALDLHDHLEAEVTDGGLQVEVSGSGAADVPRDERHLVVRAMREAFTLLGVQPPGLALRCDNVLPHSRGLGSSSAAIVAGVVLARGLVAGGELLVSDDELFQLAARMEGHPDNVAPAFFGGFVVSAADGDGFLAVRAAVDPRVSAVVFVPPTGLSTELARGLLPPTVPHRDAAANAASAALLVSALAAHPEHLLVATRDRLHQDYRRPAMPASLELVDALRADGVPAVVSGAGPTVLAFVDGPGLEARCPEGWRAHHLAVDLDGARLV
ncbi:homoserine kinase [Nocardioides perillae]|uniref:Homoserine kinase n=1 Tax=Nocardioides perillae TaxID=1119534 RepID=A0A7Y9RV43_9ACTN|nr:homoserine kinase [Nocardioides perillae]